MPRPTVVDFQGQKIPGDEMGFTPLQDQRWDEYRLEDGSRVRIRIVVTDIVRTNQKTPSGEPLVVVKSATLIDYKPPEPGREH